MKTKWTEYCRVINVFKKWLRLHHYDFVDEEMKTILFEFLDQLEGGAELLNPSAREWALLLKETLNSAARRVSKILWNFFRAGNLLTFLLQLGSWSYQFCRLSHRKSSSYGPGENRTCIYSVDHPFLMHTSDGSTPLEFHRAVTAWVGTTTNAHSFQNVRHYSSNWLVRGC